VAQGVGYELKPQHDKKKKKIFLPTVGGVEWRRLRVIHMCNISLFYKWDSRGLQNLSAVITMAGVRVWIQPQGSAFTSSTDTHTLNMYKCLQKWIFQDSSWGRWPTAHASVSQVEYGSNSCQALILPEEDPTASCAAPPFQPPQFSLLCVSPERLKRGISSQTLFLYIVGHRQPHGLLSMKWVISPACWRLGDYPALCPLGVGGSPLQRSFHPKGILIPPS
jgi:hypothetical protein